VDISVIRRKSSQLRKNAVLVIDNKIFKSSLLKTVSQVTCYFFPTGGTKFIGFYTNDVILVHSIYKQTQTQRCAQSRSQFKNEDQFIWDVTLCFWVCSFQNLDLDPEDEGSTILRNVGNC